MHKNDRVFVDGMTSVKLMDGVVRMEFFNNLGTSRNPEPESCGEIVMSQQAFLRAFNAMEDLVRQLVQAGVVKRRAAGENAPAEGSGTVPPAEASPNFQ